MSTSHDAIGSITSAFIMTCLPLIALQYVAATSSECDVLVQALNEKRLANCSDEHHVKINKLEVLLGNLNQVAPHCVDADMLVCWLSSEPPSLAFLWMFFRTETRAGIFDGWNCGRQGVPSAVLSQTMYVVCNGRWLLALVPWWWHNWLPTRRVSTCIITGSCRTVQ